MKVELLYFDGCPNYRPLLARIGELLDGPEVVPVRVRSEQAAKELRFLGSPTVRIDGRDVEPGAGERSDFGLRCRLYRTREGIAGQPADEWIVAAARGETP
jgi:hypothetical protein